MVRATVVDGGDQGFILCVNKTLIFATARGRAFFDLPESVQDRLIAKLFFYGLTGEGDVNALRGRSELRLRDGDYRVIFEDTPDGLLILGVGHRRDIYR